MKIFKFLCPFFFLFSLLAEEELSIPFSNIDKGVPTLAGACVNVVSGDYMECMQDLAIPGPTPLTLDRFYTTQNDVNTLHYGWVHNHASHIVFKTNFANGKYYYTASFLDKSRGTLKFRERSLEAHRDRKIFRLGFTSENIYNGYTNCLSGHISARTNASLIVIPRQKNHCKDGYTYPDSISLKLPSDNRLNFEKKTPYVYLLKEDRLSNGKNRYVYAHDEKCNVTEIKLENDTKLISSIQINREIRRDETGRAFFDIMASDGRRVKYLLHQFKHRTDEEREQNHDMFYHITDVQSPNAPPVHYHYTPKDGSEHKRLVCGRFLPEGRGKKIEYYRRGKNFIDGVEVFVHHDHSSTRANRVKFIQEPTGPNQEYVTTYKFIYEKMTTYVKDGLNHLTSYGIDSCNRLRSIFYYNGVHEQLPLDPSIAYAEWFLWDRKGQIICQRIDENNIPKAAKVLSYDYGGNVISEKKYGNFSGYSPPLEINERDLPVDNGCECYQKEFKYRSNLLIKAKEDNGSSVAYTYYPGTDLVASKCVNGAVHYNYEYDQDAVLTKVSVEDSCEKKITSIYPRQTAPYGLPERVEEKYVDIATGTEHLLKRVDKAYSMEGFLLQEDHYDANEAFCYTLKWEYDGHGNVLCEQNALGESIERRYDQNDNLIYQKGPRPDFEKRFTYDLMNRLTREEICWADQTLAATHEYDILGHRTATTDMHGNRTEYIFDEFGHVIEIHHPPVTQGEHPTKTLQQYDIFGNVIAVTDPRGCTTRTSYNAYGKPVKVDYPDGTTEAFEYNLDGTLKKSTAKNGLVTSYQYDEFGRVVKEADSFSTQKSTYSAFHLTSQTDPMGITTLYTYDGAGRLIKEKKAGETIRYEYDALGRVHRTTDAYTAIIKEYDLLDRVTEERVEDLQGKVYKRTQYGYDSDGNVILEINGDSCTRTEYDPLGNPTKITDPLGNMTECTYNYRKRRTTHTDPLGNQTIITNNALGKESVVLKKSASGKLLSKSQKFYDGCGNLVYSLDEDMETEWIYNETGQLLSLIEAGIKTTSYAYNSFGQLSILTKPDGAQIFHEYDAKGRLSRQYSTDFTHTYEYDCNDMPLKASNTLRTYDEYGRLASETLENGYKLKYEYDRIGRLSRFTLPDRTKINYTYEGPYLKTVSRFNYAHTYSAYDLSGNLLESTLPVNAGTISYSYDPAHQIINIEHPSWSQGHSYDAVGNLVEYTLRDSQGAFSTELKYDDLYQIKMENNNVYVHDSLHNRIKKDDTQYTINSLNQLLEQSDCKYLYDKNGNLIEEISSSGSTYYMYDTLDRLIGVKKGDREYKYHYDAFNRRISKEINNVETHYYLYQLNQEIGSYRQGILKELRILGKGRGAEIGATVAIEQDGALLVPVHNLTGSIAALLDAETGECLESHRYRAFGEGKGSSRIPWGYLSKRCDPETGFIYFGMRYYIPELGRWINPDPNGLADGPNIYAFVKNNPMRYTDLFGLSAFDLHDYHEITLPPELLTGQLSCQDFMKQHDLSRPCILNLGRPELPSGSMIALTNGMKTDFPSMYSNMMWLSDCARGYNVYGVFTPTEGFFHDLGYSGCELCGNMSSSVEMNQKLWTHFLDTRPWWTNIINFAHSRGSIIAYNAISEYPYKDDIHERMTIITLGFVKYIEEEHARKVRNYASSADPVTLVGRMSIDRMNVISAFSGGITQTLPKMMAGIYTKQPTVIPRHPSEPWYGDHNFQSKTYEVAIKKELKLFFLRDMKNI